MADTIPGGDYGEIQKLKAALRDVHKIAHIKGLNQKEFERMVDGIYHKALPGEYNPHGAPEKEYDWSKHSGLGFQTADEIGHDHP